MVLTEGAVTEPSYVAILGRAQRHTVKIILVKASVGHDPLSLIRQARDLVKAKKKRRKSERPDFDEIWCVFDQDEHLHINQALQEADDSEIRVALSNPCFELWLVLHCEDQTAAIHRHAIQRRAEALGLIDGKSICGSPAQELLIGASSSAIERAKHLTSNHEKNGFSGHENPSTGMWRLAESVQSHRDLTD